MEPQLQVAQHTLRIPGGWVADLGSTDFLRFGWPGVYCSSQKTSSTGESAAHTSRLNRGVCDNYTAVGARQVTQDHTAAGKLLSAPVIALLLGLLGAAAGVLPVQCTAYDVVWQYVMPLAAALILLESDLRECALLAAPYLHNLLLVRCEYSGDCQGAGCRGQTCRCWLALASRPLALFWAPSSRMPPSKPILGPMAGRWAPCSTLWPFVIACFLLLVHDKHMHAVIVKRGLIN